MNELKADTELRRQYKSELDEILFDDLNFDARLKEGVRRHIHPGLKRSVLNEWFGQGRRKWTYGAAVAVLAIVLLMTTPSLQDLLQPSKSENIENINSIKLEVDNPIKTPLGEGITSPTVQLWSAKTNVEEAAKWFGHGMLIPLYIPNGFTLHQINASGPKKEMAMKVIFTYSSADQLYSVFEDKNQNMAPNVFGGYETVDINGTKGHVKSDASVLDTELQWTVDGVQYMISGQISKEEVMKVAKSLKLGGYNNE
jgi:hypothetical protein